MTHDGKLSTIERALQLARSGKCLTVTDVRRTLKQERYDAVEDSTAGMAIQAQLKAAIEKAKT